MTTSQPALAPEPDRRHDFESRLSYESYLHLDRLLSAQQPLSCPAHHDEMLFIIQHQVAELWFKLILHELRSARECLRADDAVACEKRLSRIKKTQVQLFNQWEVLETLRPNEFAQFRHLLWPASGMQSFQYRAIEFILGNKNLASLEVFAHDRAAHQELRAELENPSLYDEFLRHLARSGYAVPRRCIERNWAEPHQRNPELTPVFQQIYAAPADHGPVYPLCEMLVDIDEYFQLWRFRHVKTIERIIGYDRGTGGSAGVPFLKKVIDAVFFPELLDVRTIITSVNHNGNL